MDPKPNVTIQQPKGQRSWFSGPQRSDFVFDFFLISCERLKIGSFYWCIHSFAHASDTKCMLQQSQRERGLEGTAGLGHSDLGLGPQPLRFTNHIFSVDPRDSHASLGHRLMFAQITGAEMPVCHFTEILWGDATKRQPNVSARQKDVEGS